MPTQFVVNDAYAPKRSSEDSGQSDVSQAKCNYMKWLHITMIFAILSVLVANLGCAVFTVVKTVDNHQEMSDAIEAIRNTSHPQNVEELRTALLHPVELRFLKGESLIAFLQSTLSTPLGVTIHTRDADYFMSLVVRGTKNTSIIEFGLTSNDYCNKTHATLDMSHMTLTLCGNAFDEYSPGQPVVQDVHCEDGYCHVENGTDAPTMAPTAAPTLAGQTAPVGTFIFTDAGIWRVSRYNNKPGFTPRNFTNSISRDDEYLRQVGQTQMQV